MDAGQDQRALLQSPVLSSSSLGPEWGGLHPSPAPHCGAEFLVQFRSVMANGAGMGSPAEMDGGWGFSAVGLWGQRRPLGCLVQASRRQGRCSSPRRGSVSHVGEFFTTSVHPHDCKPVPLFSGPEQFHWNPAQHGGHPDRPVWRGFTTEMRGVGGVEGASHGQEESRVNFWPQSFGLEHWRAAATPSSFLPSSLLHFLPGPPFHPLAPVLPSISPPLSPRTLAPVYLSFSHPFFH